MNTLINTILIWKLAIFRLVVHCFVVIGVGYLGAMGNQRWADLDGDSRFKLILGLGVTVLGVIIAFLDKTVANLASGDELPPGLEDSVMLSKTTETQTTPAVEATLKTPAIPEITETVVTTTTAPKAPEIKT